MGYIGFMSSSQPTNSLHDFSEGLAATTIQRVSTGLPSNPTRPLENHLQDGHPQRKKLVYNILENPIYIFTIHEAYYVQNTMQYKLGRASSTFWGGLFRAYFFFSWVSNYYVKSSKLLR